MIKGIAFGANIISILMGEIEIEHNDKHAEQKILLIRQEPNNAELIHNI